LSFFHFHLNFLFFNPCDLLFRSPPPFDQNLPPALLFLVSALTAGNLKNTFRKTNPETGILQPACQVKKFPGTTSRSRHRHIFFYSIFQLRLERDRVWKKDFFFGKELLSDSCVNAPVLLLFKINECA